MFLRAEPVTVGLSTERGLLTKGVKELAEPMPL
jgi:hypothetical protein